MVMLMCVHQAVVYNEELTAFTSRVTTNKLPYAVIRSKRYDNSSWDIDKSHVGPVVNPYQFKYVLEPRNVCDEGHLLVVYVHSDVRNFDRRAVIRKTWGNTSIYTDIQMKLFFFVAMSQRGEDDDVLRAEARENDDIIQLGFIEHYHNMTYKAIGALKWLVTRCKTVTYLLKTDDDTFVNTFALFKHIEALSEDHLYVSGLLVCCRGHLKLVYRYGKWAVNRTEYPDDYYPHYCSGIAYILTADVARAIYRTSAHVPYFWIDDVYVTGMIPEAIRLRQIDMRGAYIRDVGKIDELFAGNEWYKFAFCHVPDLHHFERLWNIVRSKALLERIPDIEVVVPGRLANNYTYRYRADLPYYYVPPLTEMINY